MNKNYIYGLDIILNEKLEPTGMKEHGVLLPNGVLMPTAVEVGEELYQRLLELEKYD